MCVRYVGVDERVERWVKRAGVWFPEGIVEPENGHFPGDLGLIYRLNENGTGQFAEAKWGLQPFWAKDEKFGKKNAYNARSETVMEKPTFREAIKKRRCVLPIATFYERFGPPRGMHWLHVAPKGDDPFLVAALWEPGNERTGGMITYTMVTTEPNDLIGQAHDRMPVMLDRASVSNWLAPDAPVDLLQALMNPWPSEWAEMADAGPVSVKKQAAEGDTLF